MSGQFLRRGTPPERHVCTPPERAHRDDVWACECGRRWTCIEDDAVCDLPDEVKGPDFEPFVDPAQWERRRWPWPRAPRPWFPPPGTGEWVDRLDPPPPWATGGSTD